MDYPPGVRSGIRETGASMVERLVILTLASTADDALARLQATGGRLLARYGDTVWVAELSPEAEAAMADDPAVQGIFAGAVPGTVTVDDEAGRLGIAAWDLRHAPSFRAARDARRGDGRAWDDEGFEPEG
jgi:hypothetical protein